MKYTAKVILLAYCCVTLLDLLFIYVDWNTARWCTKPLLMPLLAALIWMHRSKLKYYNWVLAALLLSWAGDVLLQMSGMFIPGLVSFLCAHFCYIIYFTKLAPGHSGLLQQDPLIGLPVLIYVFVFLWLLYPFLDSMRLPVTVYSITIGAMLLLSINTIGKLTQRTARLFFNGALQFVLSDSILAVNLFAFPGKVLSLCVMATYASAQYLIVSGAMETAKDS